MHHSYKDITDRIAEPPKVIVKWCYPSPVDPQNLHIHHSRMRWPGNTFKLWFRLKRERGIRARILAVWPVSKRALKGV